jgi:hypothetical protein
MKIQPQRNIEEYEGRLLDMIPTLSGFQFGRHTNAAKWDWRPAKLETKTMTSGDFVAIFEP